MANFLVTVFVIYPMWIGLSIVRFFWGDEGLQRVGRWAERKAGDIDPLRRNK